ncbi:MAG: sulfur oxidation c-type cytochrome SoxA, partial [Rubrivivax sp.]|nr:sulfur oxidation c-type cytochrome SoxA [Rubrivivax sp.]
MKGPPFAPESDSLLGLETYVAHQSRGQPVQPRADPQLRPFVQQGHKLYVQGMGQLDFSCAQCHDQQAGRRLAGSTIPQAHPTGYPLYRLEWQAVGSLQRRLRHCMSGVRA